jgi:hypothetical protein
VAPIYELNKWMKISVLLGYDVFIWLLGSRRFECTHCFYNAQLFSHSTLRSIRSWTGRKKCPLHNVVYWMPTAWLWYKFTGITNSVTVMDIKCRKAAWNPSKLVLLLLCVIQQFRKGGCLDFINCTDGRSINLTFALLRRLQWRSNSVLN